MNCGVEIRYANQQQISEHLNCVVCQCFFVDPTRLGCGHTYCYECIKGCMKRNNVCPECRVPIDLRRMKRDLVAYNLLNDEIVFCADEDKFCKWKGQLSQLQEHILHCDIYKNGVPDYIKNMDAKNKSKEMTFEQQLLGEKFEDRLNQNDNGSLLQRLFSKNKDGLDQLLNNKGSPQQKGQEQKKKQKGSDDDIQEFLDFLDDDNKNDQFLDQIRQSSQINSDKKSTQDGSNQNLDSYNSLQYCDSNGKQKQSRRKKRIKSSNPENQIQPVFQRRTRSQRNTE